jgi:hypothetical protein
MLAYRLRIAFFKKTNKKEVAKVKNNKIICRMILVAIVAVMATIFLLSVSKSFPASSPAFASIANKYAYTEASNNSDNLEEAMEKISLILDDDTLEKLLEKMESLDNENKQNKNEAIVEFIGIKIEKGFALLIPSKKTIILYGDESEAVLCFKKIPPCDDYLVDIQIFDKSDNP